MGLPGGIERELKFGDVDHQRLRRRLEELDAERRGGAAFEDNWVFDAGGELQKSGSLLRLRIDGQGSRVTFKGPATFEEGVKVRPELETAVGSAEEMRKIFEALGYSAVARYQKYREDWRLGTVVVSLDRLPIGDFAEFEGDGCDAMARRCGLDPEQAERRNYLRIYEDYLEEHQDAPPEMVFP
ncbi:MAG: class IV adenylate cyclase [Thermoanaerobaculia bacterium]